ncbi:unnamed protein product [Lactuca virosa]|uniref:Uncharacterized protein n=1 Tax=Lactuca virosa TaxID=75947 RepID=A0AAU9P7J9_9ASTR|nr:unnamed protein product [Lactuca virosa]
MACDGSWREASSSEVEHIVLDDSVDTLEDGDDFDPDYTPTERPSELSLSPDYTPAGLELLSSEYEPDVDEEDTTTSSDTSPPRRTPSHRSYRTPMGTRVKQSLRKIDATPSRKWAASPPSSPSKTKKSRRDTVWMPQIQAWAHEEAIG